MKSFFRNTKPYGQLLTLLVTMVLGFIISAGVTVFAAIFGADFQSNGYILFLQAVSQLLTFLLPALIFSWLFSDNAAEVLQLDFSGRKWLYSAAGVVLLFCLIPFANWLENINMEMHLPQSMSAVESSMRMASENSQALIESLLGTPGVGAFIVNILVIALFPAICEEFLFRGAVQQLFCRWFRNRHAAVVATAIVFSLAHGEIFAFLPRFMLGIVLGYLFLYSGSMLTNVIVHFFNNATIVVIYYLYNNGLLEQNIADDMTLPWLVVVAGVVAAVVIFWFVFLKREW